MSRVAPPTHLVWDHDPDEAEFARLVGPDFTCARVHWREDDEQLRIEPHRMSFAWSFGAVVFVALTISVWPTLLRWLFDKPDTVPRPLFLGLLAALWLVLVPIAWFLLRRAARRSQARPCAVEVSKQTGELHLPASGRRAGPEDLLRFVEVRGRVRHGQRVAPYRQLGVLLRDGPKVVFVCFARLTTPARGRGILGRLADHFDRPLQVVQAGTL